MKKVKTVVLWIISGFLVLLTLGISFSSIPAAIFMLLAAIGCNPFVLSIMEQIGKKLKKIILIPTVIVLFFVSIILTPTNKSSTYDNNGAEVTKATPEVTKIEETTKEPVQQVEEPTDVATTNKPQEDIVQASQDIQPQATPNDSTTMEYDGIVYTVIEVDGDNLSGSRKANVAVDVGYGDRVYWAFTNEYGQLVNVIADQLIPQNDTIEPVNSNGRYYNDEAKVPGTEDDDLDEGHVIADSLGGVSNAYNITPQNSTLNRYGDQAYMEKVISDAGGCENFVATITYPNNTTQIPSHYHFEYDLKGNHVVDDFDNVNSDDESTEQLSGNSSEATENTTSGDEDLSSVDTNGNGKVTIAEAKAAGYGMPIYSDHWLYEYMDDRDHDGMVGE